jgi:hypothetical protein
MAMMMMMMSSVFFSEMWFFAFSFLFLPSLPSLPFLFFPSRCRFPSPPPFGQQQQHTEEASCPF